MAPQAWFQEGNPWVTAGYAVAGQAMMPNVREMANCVRNPMARTHVELDADIRAFIEGQVKTQVPVHRLSVETICFPSYNFV